MSDTFVSGHGSQQCRLLRRGIRDGLTVEEAARRADYDIDTARLIAADDLKNPPPEEAYVLLYDPEARAAASPQSKEPVMARGRMARAPKDDDTGAVKEMDLERARKLYFGDIKPALSEAAAQQQVAGQGYKAIDKECHIRRDSAKLAFKMAEMEDTRRDDFLRGFCAMLNEVTGQKLVTFHSRDLVDLSKDDDATTTRPRPRLVTPPPVPADDSDLLGDFTEATEQEVAQQKGRRKKTAEKAEGEGEA